MRRRAAFAVMIFTAVAAGAQPQREKDKSVSTVVAAARAYAGALAESGSEEFARLFRLAFRLGMGDLLAEEPSGERNDTSAAGVEADSRYTKNLEDLTPDKEKIWGGKRVRPGDYPDVVAITGPGGSCTGTLVAPNAVLTARHCLCGDVDEAVLFGDDVRAARRTVKVDAARTAKSSQCVRTLDFAVLVLSEDVTDVTPRRISTSMWINEAKSVRAVGFGRTEDPDAEPSGIKRNVDIPVASPACNGHVDLLSGAREDATFYRCVKGRELVAGSPLLDRDSCNGDSGGPIFLSQGTDEYLAGLTSRAVRRKGYRPCGDGGIYIRADGEVLQWLNDHGITVNVGAPPAAPQAGATGGTGSGGQESAARAEAADVTAEGVSSGAVVVPTQPSSAGTPLKRSVTIAGSISDLPDGRVAVISSDPEAAPIVIANAETISEAAKTLPLSVRLAPSSEGAQLTSAVLTSEAQWAATKRKLPREIADALDVRYKQLGTAVQALLRSDAADSSELAPTIDAVRQAYIENYRKLQAAGREARRTFLENYLAVQKTRKSIYGANDVYPTASYERIFQASRAVGALALRGDAPECSGVLIADDLFLTARHCVDKFSPEELEVQFNYDEDLRHQPLSTDTYPVLAYEVIGSAETPNDAPLDYAIIRLGRNENDEIAGKQWTRECMSMKRLRLYDAVYAIGHPQGERRKVHDNSRVFFPFRLTQGEMDELLVSVEAELLDDRDGADKLDSFLKSYRPLKQGSVVMYEQRSVKWQRLPVIGVDTDTFHGNSGSPVFDRKRHHIMGVFFAGEPDTAAYTPGWRRHEAVLPISEVVRQLKADHSAWLNNNAVCIVDDNQVASR